MQTSKCSKTEKDNAVGSFCLVLHGHMPYVLHHGLWPHGEDWLYEAAAECYLPLLALIDECRHFNCNPQFAIGLTPVLLEQLAHEDFKSGFEEYLLDRVNQARADKADFKRQGQMHMAYLAERWELFFTDLYEQFDRIEQDIPRAFALASERGLIQMLTSSATHAYLPLLLEDSCVRAQVRAGISSSKRILGLRPNGIWLPEGAYRPGGPWSPPIPWGAKNSRLAIDQIITDENLSHFFVENHMFQNNRKLQDGDYQFPITNHQSLEPVLVNNDGNGSPLKGRPIAFARDPDICKQVWCGFVGYPADGVYLEFHKRHGPRRGLRYWKVTDRRYGLEGKQLYYPDDVAGKIYEHARHFCWQVKKHLSEYYRQTGRRGVVVACFDAELFGHWWFEGPRFLRDVLLTLNADPEVQLCTPEAYIGKYPPARIVSLSEGSWGEGGDHRIWTNQKVGWMWRIEYRCESLFGKLTYHLPWRKHYGLRKILEKAGRELLLLQASDWPFVIARGQADDYGIKRFIGHVSRFECLTDIAENIAINLPGNAGSGSSGSSGISYSLNKVQKFELQDADVHDVIFPEIDLNWWNM
jgi:1,4-alpha-glucan branching enzyme